ncbi:hypothetical protein KC614_01955 [candidate division WWE3 bacterium]|uniref:Uncharacterized protein n=1 Tax=candidate division WWE3 bacterium TaxID=2053526 RepID=A0A955RRY8_UNCKA|nr:hypothetical protein [candidate division WWE3 bacterium]
MPRYTKTQNAALLIGMALGILAGWGVAISLQLQPEGLVVAIVLGGIVGGVVGTIGQLVLILSR